MLTIPPIKPPTYIIYKESGFVKAVDGQTGRVKKKDVDARTVIQWALDNLPSEGGKVFVKGGEYIINSPILIQGKNNVVFEGEGWRSTKLVTSGPDTTCIKIGERANAALESRNIVVKGFFIDGSSQTTETTTPETVDRRFGIEIASRSGIDTDCLITENYIYNTGSDGIYAYYARRNMIINNIIEAVRGYWGGWHGHGSGNYALIMGNIIFNCNCSGIRHGAVIANNYLYDNGLSGATDGREAQIVGSRDAVIVGNYVDYYYRARLGIKTWDDHNVIVGNRVSLSIATTSGYTGHVIIGNTIYRATGGAAINLSRTNGAVVAYNTLYQIAGAHGIQLLGCQRCVVKGNVLQDIGYSANNTYDGIRLEASGSTNCLYNIIVNNQIFSGQTNKPRYGIVEADANQDYNIIANNIVTDCATQAILKQGVNSLVKNNVGYVTENSGIATGTGAQQAIPHGCSFTPTKAQVILSNIDDGANPYLSADPDATNIYVTAVNGKTYRWEVKMNP